MRENITPYKDGKRMVLHASLSQHALSPATQQLLTATSLVGASLSLKQRLSVTLNRQRAGTL